MTKFVDKIKENKRAHDIIASKYNIRHEEIFNPIEQKRLEKLIGELISMVEEKEINILDFGAGTGNLTNFFLKYNAKVTATDISEKSLRILKNRFNSSSLSTKIINGITLPFANQIFDISATYSVLHHIPDYLSAIKEMIRVTKIGGLIYIDHEGNKEKWGENLHLTKYLRLTKKTTLEHLIKLIKTKELFSWSFWKSLFIMIFIDKRHKREGDIHIWQDDHIDWQLIKSLFKSNGCRLIKEKDYLMFKVKGGVELFDKYKQICTDTKYCIFKKVKNI